MTQKRLRIAYSSVVICKCDWRSGSNLTFLMPSITTDMRIFLTQLPANFLSSPVSRTTTTLTVAICQFDNILSRYNEECNQDNHLCHWGLAYNTTNHGYTVIMTAYPWHLDDRSYSIAKSDVRLLMKTSHLNVLGVKLPMTALYLQWEH